jgi:hypothetical protein
MIERGSCVPSSMPRRFDSEPAATLRTTTSSGMISTSRISCSRMLRRRMKWVGTPIVVERCEDMLGDAVVEHALAVDHPCFLALKAVASSLKYWIRCPAPDPRRGSWPCLRRSGGGGGALAPAGQPVNLGDGGGGTRRGRIDDPIECQLGATVIEPVVGDRQHVANDGGGSGGGRRDRAWDSRKKNGCSEHKKC